MLAALHKPLRAILLLTPLIVALTIAGLGSPRSPAKGSTQSTSDAPVYLPPGQTDASLFSVILASLSEPSLLEAAKDSSVHSYRVSYFSPVPTHEMAVRLVVSADGSGQIASVVSSGEASGVKRTKNSVSSADVDKFLQLVEKAGFWSMSSNEDTEQKDAAGRKLYVLDGSFWMVEGVRNGSFHYVYRRNPKPSPITEIGCYLAKGLAKIDDSVISMRQCTSHGQ
jgi:hypothetical protein